jgi:beta-glucosidase
MTRIRNLLVIIFLFFFLCTGCKNQPKDILSVYENKADSIIKLMTLDEKVGQLSLFTSDWSTTGPSMRKDYVDLIKQGKAGNVFNAYTVDYVKELQRIAVEETQLHIPLLFRF